MIRRSNFLATALVLTSHCVPEVRLVYQDASTDAFDLQTIDQPLSLADLTSSDHADSGIDMLSRDAGISPDLRTDTPFEDTIQADLVVDGSRFDVQDSSAGDSGLDGGIGDSADGSLGADRSEAGDDVCRTGGCIGQRSCPSSAERGCGVVEIPEGIFSMGSLEVVEGGADPIQSNIHINAFSMDAFEVTVARFRRFWNDGHPAPPSSVEYPSGPYSWTGMVRVPSTDLNCTWTATPGISEGHPINCVTWQTAQAFCVWDGGRLPTEAEWEFVARARPVEGTTTPRRFPWGSEPISSAGRVCDRAQLLFECAGENGVESRPVGSFPPNGNVFDLSGNVAEWLADQFQLYNHDRCWGMVSGRSNPLCRERSVPVQVSYRGCTTHCASRAALGDDYPSPAIGFRCVRSR